MVENSTKSLTINNNKLINELIMNHGGNRVAGMAINVVETAIMTCWSSKRRIAKQKIGIYVKNIASLPIIFRRSFHFTKNS